MMDCLIAVSGVFTAFGTVALASIAWYQLSELRKQIIIQGDREKQWRTIAACERYTFDPVLKESKRRLYEARDMGKGNHYNDPSLVKIDALTLVNYLDVIGTGVAQGVYIKEIVEDHLHIVVKSVVQDFVKNGFGEFGINEDHITGLMKLYTIFTENPITYSTKV